MVELSWFFLSFRGRICRQEYCIGQLALLFIQIVLIVSITKIGASHGPVYYVESRPPDPVLGRETIAMLAVCILAAWPYNAVVVKRLHDLDMSGWWIAAWYGIVLMITLVAPAAVRWLPLITVVLGAIPGAVGANRFGAWR